MRPSLLRTPTDKRIGRPAGITSTSDQIIPQAGRLSPTRYDRRKPRALSSKAEDDFAVLQRQLTYSDIDNVVGPDEYDPLTGPYDSQAFINKNTHAISPPSGFKTPMVPKPEHSQGMTRRESSYFGDFSFDQQGSATAGPNSDKKKLEPVSSYKLVPTPSGSVNKSFSIHTQDSVDTRVTAGPTGPTSIEPQGQDTGSTVSANLSSNGSSKGTEHSRVSTFGRWFNKGTPDLRMIKFAKERKISLRRRQEAEPPPPEPSPRITSFYHQHEYDRLQRERECEREIEENVDAELNKSPDVALRHPSMLKKVASSINLVTPHSIRPAVIRAITKSSHGSTVSTADSSPVIDTSILEDSVTVSQRPATPGLKHHKPFWQPRRRLSDGFSQSVMEDAQLAKSRRAFRDPSSDNSDKSSKYHPSPRYLQPQSSPGSAGSSNWFRGLRPRIARFHSSEYSPGDTSEKAMNRPALQTYQTFPAARNPMEPPSKNATFLPSEARRINTPPMVTTSQDKGNKVTSYFWDFWYNDDDNKKSNKAGPSPDANEYHQPFPQPNLDSTSDPKAHPGIDSEKDWYRVRLDRIMDEEEPRDLGELRIFDWDIPEHLPSSPLCPLHAKYQGRGKRVCVYHGRRENPRAFADLGMEAWA